MRDRLLDHRDGDQRLTGLLHALADRFGDFAGLADREPDAALLVADDDERREAEALTALDDLRHAVDADDGLLEPLVVAVATATIVHALELQTGFARCLSARCDATGILVTGRVEDHGIEPGGLRARGDRRTDLLGGLDVRARAEAVGDGALARRRGDERMTLRVVDDERVGVVQAAEDLQARAGFRSDDLLAKTRVSLQALRVA